MLNFKQMGKSGGNGIFCDDIKNKHGFTTFPSLCNKLPPTQQFKTSFIPS